MFRTLSPVLDDADVIYMHAALSALTQCIIQPLVLLQVMGLELITVFFTTKFDAIFIRKEGTALHGFYL